MDKNVNIYCFSGTGNSLYTARKIAERTGGTVTLITREGVEAAQYPQADTAVIVFPSYAYGLPSLVRRFLRVMPLPSGYTAAVVTCGSVYGGSLRHAEKLLKKRGGRLDYACGIDAVENFLPIFGAPKADKRQKRLDLHQMQSGTAADAIGSDTRTNKLRAPFYAGAVSAIFRAARPLLSLTMRIRKSCTGCGLCIEVCPGAALQTKPGRVRPKRKHTACEVCQACVNVCPHKSVTMLRARAKSGRYFHPEVKITDLRTRDK